MPQLARAPASLRRPGASQQDGALYCACERQRTTGATRQNLLYVNANVCIHYALTHESITSPLNVY
ncbi:hypothetical protein [Salmonella enterica]|uniref:hypothetical protein n=1 Tax=Salmonella enterica TaxID=28901 RepID=UPI00127EAC8B|nr:hypothetical protein [Salmonella enterica]EBA0300811.1 hypothetical protein [Salmonella enterica]ECH0249658.1 hypothetical protein [Salmonella enterica]